MKYGWAWAAVATVILAAPASARGQEFPMAMDDRAVYTYVAFHELEVLPAYGSRPLGYDGMAWVGGDFNRLWVKARGEHPTSGGGAGRVEGQLLYGRVLAPYWDVQAGVGVDALYGRDDVTARARGLLSVSLQGLAPYWFELESALYVSHEGDVFARLQASYELLLTQRLILEPEARIELAAQDVPDFEMGRGLSELEGAARVRYEIMRELAPYVGVSWVTRPADAADESDEGASFVVGLRWWY